ncbi:MAG: type II secretion system protein [Firmicutes bacterium]|nr:type II secretion system protein [Bacillota bacterium]
MKKKGFTLIELLAVIVVLAIIALIATPIVMNVISNAQKGAAERSADNYIKAVETLIATKRLDGEPVEDGTYEIDENGNLEFGTVELSGTKPNGGSIKIENGQVVKENASIKVGDYTVTFEDGKAEAEKGNALAKLSDVCDYQSLPGAENTIGSEYICNVGDGDRTFYVLEPGTSSKPVTLILEGALQGGSWANAQQTLDQTREIWTKLDRSQIGLPSIEQIMVADDRDADEYLTSDEVYLDNEWLYDVPFIDGYWTSTIGADNYVWMIFSDGQVGADHVEGRGRYDVRPVIMLSI